MNVLVTKVEVSPGSTLGYGWGTDEANGDELFFAGDWRPMAVLAEVVSEGAIIAVDVESWQVIRRTPTRAPGELMEEFGK